MTYIYQTDHLSLSHSTLTINSNPSILYLWKSTTFLSARARPYAVCVTHAHTFAARSQIYRRQCWHSTKNFVPFI